MMDLHGDALKRILGDMDDLEGKRMFPMPGAGDGATITISVSPGHAEPDGDEGNEMPDHDEDECMNKGGCAYHKGGLAYNKGGMVKEDADTAEDLPATPKMAEGGAIGMPGMGETDELGLPPFLRKKKALGTK